MAPLHALKLKLGHAALPRMPILHSQMPHESALCSVAAWACDFARRDEILEEVRAGFGKGREDELVRTCHGVLCLSVSPEECILQRRMSRLPLTRESIVEDDCNSVLDLLVYSQ